MSDTVTLRGQGRKFFEGWLDHKGRQSPNMPVIRRYLISCKDSVNSVFDSSVHVMSTEETSVGRAVAASIDDFITDENVKILTVLNVYSMEKMLGEQRWYCMPLLQSLAGSCLPYCPALINLIDRVRRNHPNAARFSTTLQREKPDPTGFSIDPKATHGVEHSNLANLRHEKLVINMEFCMETSTNAPKSIAAEGVLLQYMVDTHLDNIWHSYLTQLMTEPYFPSNPYPELVSFFRQQAMKMDLYFTTEREVIKPLFASEVIIDDPDNFIYTISGVDCYGVLSALQVLDTATFMPLSQSLQPFFTENFTLKKGPFKVAICLAMSGPCILYGKMQPYLTEVELHEHFFVQGPPGCSTDVVRLCALIVGKSVNELIKKNETAVSGVYLGNERWSFADISTRLDAFVKSFVYSVSRKQPAYLMGFIVLDEWRFVTVKKYYLIRYVTEEGKRGKLFYPENPLEIYQSVFFSSEKAAFFYQNCGLPYNGDPMGDANIQAVTGEMDSLIITAMVHSDWLNVHRFLLLKCLMKQKLPINSDELENEDLNLTEYIDSKGLDHVTEAWFILQSIAALIEYIISLANTLQDLLPLYQDSELYSVRIETMLKNLEPPEEEIDKKKKKKKKNQVPEPPVRKLPEQFIEDFKFTVDEAAYGKMTMVFHKKLLEICQAKIVMASFAFDEYVESKLNECLQEDATYNNLYLIYDVQTLQRLDEIKSMLHALQDSLAYDVHLISPEAIKFFNNIKASDLNRKTHLSSRVSEKSHSSSQKQRTPRSALSFDLAPVNSIRAGKTFGGFVDDRPDTFGDPFRALTPFDYNIPDMSEKERKQKEKEKKKKKSKKPEERVFLLTPVEDNSQEDL